MSITNTIREQIEKEIFEGSIPAGENIDEKYVMSRFNVSRTPARETLVQLAALDLIGLVPRKGYRVLPLTPKEYIDLSEILEVNEALAARLAASRITKDQLLRLKESLDLCLNFAIKEDAVNYKIANSKFHQVIYDASYNKNLYQTIILIRARMRGITDVRFTSTSKMKNSYDEHLKIYEAIKNGDPTNAAASMETHIKNGSGNLKEIIR